MKKIIILIFASWLIGSCGSVPKPVVYKIQGKIVNADNKKAELTTFDKDLKPISLDTVVIKDSVFQFNISPQNPTIGIIKIINTKKSIPIIMGDGDVIIKVASPNPFLSDLTGTTSALTKKFFAYELHANNDKKKGIALMQEYRRTIANKKDSIKELFFQWQKNAENYQYEYIKNNKDIVGLIIMQTLVASPQADFGKIKQAFDGYPESVKTNNLGKHINTILLTKGATAIGGKAPNFIGTMPNGNKLSLNQAMGKVTVIDFWASWCRPCRGENPYVVQIYNKYHDQGLNIIGVSLDKEKKSWLSAIKDDGLKWQHVSELKYWNDPIAKMYGVFSIPQVFILDSRGIIRAKNLRRDELEKKIVELLNE